MGQPTPFFSALQPFCASYRWKNWAGYLGACSYEQSHDAEYYTLRHAVGAIDVSPLYKYAVSGVDAVKFLSRVMVRDVGRLGLGQVAYTCWCDDDGKTVDDGTVTRWGENSFWVTSAEPSWGWFQRLARRWSVQIDDISKQWAILAIQGPNSRTLLNSFLNEDFSALKFFRAVKKETKSYGEVVISRTGYTGDLGYEVWVEPEKASAFWNGLYAKGNAFRLAPVGLDALDVTRIEAGFVLNGVEYFSAPQCLLENRKSSPFELGLGWMVQLDRGPFLGQKALQFEKEKGSPTALVGVTMDWEHFQELHDRAGSIPEVCTQASRTSFPVYSIEGIQAGYVTSSTWSPILKKFIGLATVDPRLSVPGTALWMETTVEYKRENVRAEIVRLPFFDPERKKK